MLLRAKRVAIKLTNNTLYSLNVAVYSTDVFTALRVVKQLDFSQVYINTMTEYDKANALIRGVKGSG
jgi:acyl-CoA reductase-like NAD-dependent aldehyde dehydrogenase